MYACIFHQLASLQFEQVVRLNLMSCFHVLKPTVKAMMKSGGGSIAFCTSAGTPHGQRMVNAGQPILTVARHGIPNHEAIAAAKACTGIDCCIPITRIITGRRVWAHAQRSRNVRTQKHPHQLRGARIGALQ